MGIEAGRVKTRDLLKGQLVAGGGFFNSSFHPSIRAWAPWCSALSLSPFSTQMGEAGVDVDVFGGQRKGLFCGCECGLEVAACKLHLG